MPQEPEQAGAGEHEVPSPRSSRLQRPLILMLVSLGLVSGGAVIGTAARAASSSSETATVQESPSDASTTQAQEGDESQRDCPEKEEAQESA